MYRVHCAAIFAIAQLSCFNKPGTEMFVFVKSSNSYVIRVSAVSTNDGHGTYGDDESGRHPTVTQHKEGN